VKTQHLGDFSSMLRTVRYGSAVSNKTGLRVQKEYQKTTFICYRYINPSTKMQGCPMYFVQYYKVQIFKSMKSTVQIMPDTSTLIRTFCKKHVQLKSRIVQ